ncbi:tyrosine-type recombinase/integrase [Pedococcus sp. 5OH_020]|uniref:tyrosine-type recombinase/integrase n=1 Tax=Pedococcus sp. 5OH_020 TaxID=2989814 RepID=UPI0022E9BF34|nr:site-specific integrase [Pedococcus sp. 5OH_020]
MPRKPATPPLDALLPSWLLSLRADRKSEPTLKSHADGVRFYLAWCTQNGAEPLDRSRLRGWVAALLDGGNQLATARSRQLAVRRFTAWLAEEGALPDDPFVGIKAPRLDTAVVEPLSEDPLRALLKACQPPRGATPAEALRHRRDGVDAVSRWTLGIVWLVAESTTSHLLPRASSGGEGHGRVSRADSWHPSLPGYRHGDLYGRPVTAERLGRTRKPACHASRR